MEITQTISENKEAYEHFVKGYRYYSLYTRDFNELALKEFRQAIRLDSAFGRAYGGLANAFNMRVINYGYERKWLDSSGYYSLIGLEYDKSCAECYKAYGQAQGQYMENLRKALSINPNYPNALSIISRSLREHGDLEESLPYLKRLNSIEPDERGFDIANMYFVLGFYDKAKGYLQAYLNKKPANTVVSWIFAQSWQKRRI